MFVGAKTRGLLQGRGQHHGSSSSMVFPGDLK
jgi:hypothetical protein